MFLFQVSNVLEKGGASHAKYIVLGVTHLICGENYNENDITEASEVYEIPPVTESWVVASLKLGRLASTKCYNPLLSKLFPNLIFAITNISPKDKKTLIAIIEFHGGKVLLNFNKTTTHLICGSASGPAYNRALELKQDSLTVATPNWIIDCLKNKSLVNSEMYHPKFLIVPQLKMVLKPQVSAEPDKPNSSLTSILGFDFAESNKTEIKDKKEEETVKETVPPKPIQTPVVTAPTIVAQPQIITQKPQNVIQQQQQIQAPGQIQLVRGQMTPQQQHQQIQQIRAQYSQLNPQQQQQFQKQTQQIVATSTMANITGNVNTGGIMITKTNQIAAEQSEIINQQPQQQQQTNQSASSSIEEANQQLRQHLENFASQYQNKAPGQQIIVSINVP